MKEKKTVRQTTLGFTLIEMLVTIAIIGVLATISVVAVTNARETAQVNKVKGDLSHVRTAISLLVDDTGKWPNGCPVGEIVNGSNNEVYVDQSEAGLLSAPPVGVIDDPCEWTASEVSQWNGPYIDRVTDPWGNVYYFDNDYTPYSEAGCATPDESETAVVVSFGPDGDGPNDYDCDDIFLRLQ